MAPTRQIKAVPRRSGLSRLLRLLLWLPFLATILVALLISPAFSDKPLVSGGRSLDTYSASGANRFVRRSLTQLSSNRRPLILSVSGEEINALIALASRALPALNGRASISPAGIDYAFSLKIPPNPLADYFSISGRIGSSMEGLDLGSLKIGNLQLPGALLNYLTEQLLNSALGNDQGSLLLQSVRSLSTHRNVALLMTDPPRDLPRRLERISQRFKQMSADAGLFANAGDMRHYFGLLQRQQPAVLRSRALSLVGFLNPLMQEAARRSGPDNAVAQNRAAILALAVFLGSYHFEKLVGDISPEGYRSPLWLRRVSLAERRDLRLHFVFSAALRVLSDQGVSLTLGEFKELLDSETGGSGFSFVDLAADRAGARFAEIATRDQHSAIRLQQKFSTTQPESELFPAIGGLPENIAERDFNRRYRDLDSPAYRAMEQLIDQRLGQLSLYRY